MTRKNNGNVYEAITPQGKSNVPKRKNRKSSQNQPYVRSITNQWEFQQDLHTIGIYDHEWEALHNSVQEIKGECSKFNIGPILDGFGITISIPLFIDFMKIIQSKGTASNDLVNECLIYFGLLMLYIISMIIRKIFKPSWLTSYTRFDSDIKNLDDRMNEIEKRIGIKKE